MRLLTQKQAQELDRLSVDDHKISEESLMDMAGQQVANVIQSELKDQNSLSIKIVCGKGNNGGDGFAAAFYLNKMDYKVTVYSRRSIYKLYDYIYIYI